MKGVYFCTRNNTLSTGRYHRYTRIFFRMRSARLATVTVALFRQIDTILGFRSFSKGPQRLLSSQTTQTGYRSLSLLSCRSTDSKFTLQRQLSTSDETENPYGKSSSFSVPAMGTDLVEDGSDYSLYERWVRRLYATNWYHPVKLGLQNMQQLDKLLGNPLDDVSTSYSSSLCGLALSLLV